MKVTLSDIYKAIKEQTDYVNLNNTIHSLEYAKGIIEFEVDGLADEFNHMIANGPAILTTKEKD